MKFREYLKEDSINEAPKVTWTSMKMDKEIAKEIKSLGGTLKNDGRESTDGLYRFDLPKGKDPSFTAIVEEMNEAQYPGIEAASKIYKKALKDMALGKLVDTQITEYVTKEMEKMYTEVYEKSGSKYAAQEFIQYVESDFEMMEDVASGVLKYISKNRKKF